MDLVTYESPVWVVGKDGWHRAKEMHGGTAQALCGNRVQASMLFSTDRPPKNQPGLRDKPICETCSTA